MNILSIGDLLVDLIIRYNPLSGEADIGRDSVQVLAGGSAANFAAHAARLGANVQFVSRVGRDWAGDMLARSLSDEGVTPHVRVVEEEATGRVLSMVDAQGHNRMWTYPGASSTLSPDDLDSAWFQGLDAFHLTGYSLLREGPRAAAHLALELARAYGAPLCTLDPNPSHLISDFGPERFREIIRELSFDVIFPNLEEGMLLSGKQHPDDVITSLLSISKTVVLTLGEQGCIAATREERVKMPAMPATVVDTTGAGDAFAAGFVVEYLDMRDLRSATFAAGRLAAQVVSSAGAR